MSLNVFNLHIIESLADDWGTLPNMLDRKGFKSNDLKYPMDEFKFFISNDPSNRSNKEKLNIDEFYNYEIYINDTFKKDDHLFIINGDLILSCIPLTLAIKHHS
jgi:hypothetical protein